MRLLFVCLGNICRSPMAEGIFRSLANKSNLQLELDSAGTAGYHKGEKPDARAIRCCSARGVDISQLRARPFEAADFGKFDRIYAMDLANYQNILKQAPDEESKNKVELFLVAGNAKATEVPDPWYGGMSDFEEVYDMLSEASQTIIEKLKKINKIE